MAEVVASVSQAVTELGQAGYDAVLLRVDEPGEISLLLRIRASVPQATILALVPDKNRELEILARESGADGVLPARHDSVDALTDVARALDSTQDLLARSRDVAKKSRAARERMMELLVQRRPLYDRAFELAEIPVQDFLPLLVEDDSSQAMFLTRTFRKLKLPFPLPVMKDGEEAIAYLQGTGPYTDRSKHPLPTLVISDLRLPRKSGLDLLQWIRSQPPLLDIPLFMLSSSDLKSDIDRALELGADGYFIKPLTLDRLTETSQRIAMRWASIRRLKALRRGGATPRDPTPGIP